ncbi:MAG: hypothetical protein JXK94_08740 [Deltaproteobacteria bacterium]|nr:hypothetical protein [Deltaproteobacteria bacterium]
MGNHAFQIIAVKIPIIPPRQNLFIQLPIQGKNHALLKTGKLYQFYDMGSHICIGFFHKNCINHFEKTLFQQPFPFLTFNISNFFKILRLKLTFEKPNSTFFRTYQIYQ